MKIYQIMVVSKVYGHLGFVEGLGYRQHTGDLLDINSQLHLTSFSVGIPSRIRLDFHFIKDMP